ncbi:hypothetical protein MJO28_010628 [Puccinia striiformis f. sp. tritici]|uniref:Uncharacterized protein n=1 Tax=Puccinia striiformis f. sp. tritici TaxID=168172 RepID=A0ACC0E871_9BASI|nr:hypothetical protein MJO28_010628 [Puccinia striiformis f. sp. tritici]
MSACAMGKLHECVGDDLHPVLIGYSKDIYGAVEALAGACCEKQVIRLVEKLFALVNTTYFPGHSLSDHVTSYRKKYSALKMSIQENPDFMTCSMGLAVQTLFDMKPFTFEKIYDQLLLEETRQTSIALESAYFSAQNCKAGKQPVNRAASGSSSHGSGSSQGNHRAGSINRGSFRGVTPTRPAALSSDSVPSSKFEKMFNLSMAKYMAAHANLATEGNDDYADALAEDDEDDFYDDDADDGCFALFEELNVNDSGASKTTLCDFNLLIDPKPVSKAIHTYSGSIQITHVGKFKMRGTIYPVFYAPDGPRNLISVSQLEDLKVVGKNRIFLIRLGQKIVYRFPQVGNLYEAQIPRNNTANYVMNISDSDPEADYHILLGHPSDEYLKQFFKLNGITPTNKNQLASNCEVCKRCKLKRSPHSNPLPTADRPFKTLHMDVLQISPPSKSSMKYILVIINNYSRFNRIYLMRRKSESEGEIISYINEIINKTGICVEAGPASSPQTNGLAKRFDQALLVKITCLLAQSSVPINFWDKAARYDSTLINILPLKALNWLSLVMVLSELNSCMEPIRDINKLIPFGLKLHVSHRPPSKISAPSNPLICLGYEDHSDALQFFDSTKRHLVISRDYSPVKLAFAYNNPSSLTKPPNTLPGHEIASIKFTPTTNAIVNENSSVHTQPVPSTLNSSPPPLLDEPPSPFLKRIQTVQSSSTQATQRKISESNNAATNEAGKSRSKPGSQLVPSDIPPKKQILLQHRFWFSKIGVAGKQANRYVLAGHSTFSVGSPGPASVTTL